MKTVETEETLKGIAERIREMRAIKGMSVAELAELTGVSEETCRKIEAAESDPSFSFLHRCAGVFDIDLMIAAGRTYGQAVRPAGDARRRRCRHGPRDGDRDQEHGGDVQESSGHPVFRDL